MYMYSTNNLQIQLQFVICIYFPMDVISVWVTIKSAEMAGIYEDSRPTFSASKYSVTMLESKVL